MKFTVEQIKNSENPYLEIGQGDALAEHNVELNSLTQEEKRELAIKIIRGCPADKISEYGRLISAAKINYFSEDGFYEALYKAFEVRMKIASLTDARQKSPHNYFLGEEFNADLFNEYNELALFMLTGQAKPAACALALSTPSSQRSSLVRNIKCIFPESEFLKNLSSAILLRNTLDLLLGENPEQFFISPEYNSELCLNFVDMMLQLVEPEGESIGLKLAKIESEEVRTQVALKLSELGTLDEDQEDIELNASKAKLWDFFNRLALFSQVVSRLPNHKELQAHVPINNSNTLFSEVRKRPVSSDNSSTEELTLSESEEYDSDNAVNSCCFGLIPY